MESITNSANSSLAELGRCSDDVTRCPVKSQLVEFFLTVAMILIGALLLKILAEALGWVNLTYLPLSAIEERGIAAKIFL